MTRQSSKIEVKKSNKKYYHQIIPLVRLPLNKSNEFTYYFSEKIPFGSVVKVKLNNKIIRGVVVGRNAEIVLPPRLKNKSNFKISPILKIITLAQITKQQLKLAKLISQYYLTPLSTTLKFFAFKITKKDNPNYFKNLKQEIINLQEKKWQQQITLTSAQKKAVEEITSIPTDKRKSKKNKLSTLLFGPPASGKTEVAIEVIKQIIRNQQQTLVLIPEIFLSYQEILRYSQRFFSEFQQQFTSSSSSKNFTKNQKTYFNENSIAILHSQLKPSEITTIWNGVRSGQIKLVVSTRMGVFLPFQKLGLIVIDEEQDISHKQWDTPPFYHSKKISEFIQQINLTQQQSKSQKHSLCQILLLSSTPSTESYHEALNKKKYQLIKLPSLTFNKHYNKTDISTSTKIKIQPPKIKLVDLKKYYRKGQQIFISNELRFALKNILNNNQNKKKKKKIAFILVPRRGKSRQIICQDCQETPTCPDCQVPLTHSENYYRCLHCNFKISNISKCPHCGSFRLSDLGFGTESIQDYIQTIFPQAKIAVADRTTFADNFYRQKILRQLYNNEIDFLVGTYAIAKGLDVDSVNLVAIINTDNWPGQTDFRFDENYLSTLFQLSGRVNRPGGEQNGQALLQTFDPTNRLFTYLQNWNWKGFLNYELKNRKSLKYSPFTHLVKITHRNRNQQIVERELKKLYQKFSLYIKSNKQDSIQLLSPYYGHQEKLRGYYQKHLLLKIPLKLFPLTDEKFLKIFSLPTGWKIDVDTENIF